MILHSGWESCIETGSIIAILNKETVEKSDITGAFLKNAKKKGGFFGAEHGEQSYIVTEDKNGRSVVASSLHAVTLFKRVSANITEDN